MTPMNGQVLQVDVHRGVATLTLDFRGNRNAFSRVMQNRGLEQRLCTCSYTRTTR